MTKVVKNRAPDPGRRTPERTCVICRERRGKDGLVRVARLPNGSVSVDPTGKGPGRGAYVCRQRACWDDDQLRQRLGRALKTVLTDADLGALCEFAASLPEDVGHAI